VANIAPGVKVRGLPSTEAGSQARGTGEPISSTAFPEGSWM